MNAAFPKGAPSWRRYLRFWRRDVHADTDDEIRLHLEARVDDLIASGVAPEAARVQAIEEFGDVEIVRRDLRAIDGGIERNLARRDLFGALRDDLRYTVRSLARSRGFVVMVVTAMALGLGLNAAMFTFIDEVFFRPPEGVSGAASVRRVWITHFNMSDHQPFSTDRTGYPTYHVLQRAVGPGADLAAYSITKAAPIGRGPGTPTAVAAFTTTNYLRVLGGRIDRGRWFSDAENQLGGGAPVSVVSGAFADRQGVGIGSTLTIAGNVTTVIGVAGDGFAGPDLDAVEVWLPIGLDTSDAGDRLPWWRSRNYYGLSMIARVSPAAAQPILDQRLTAANRADQRLQKNGDTLQMVSFGAINEARGPGRADPSVTVATRLAGVALLVLLIACANVINLLLARAVLRRREFAIRVALGVPRGRLARLITTESIVLAVLAGSAALAAAYWGGTLLRALLLPGTRWSQSVVSWRIVALTAVASLAAGAIVGLVPAIRASAPHMANFLRGGGDAGSTQRSRLRATLIGVQAALALALLVMALLFVTSLRNVQGIDFGYDADRLLFARVAFESPGRSTAALEEQTVRSLASELATDRAIESVALASITPMRGFSFMTAFVGGDTLERSIADSQDYPSFSAVSPSYFRTVGTRFMRGRTFSAGSSERAVIVNEHMARVVWHGADPIGQCIRFTSRTAPCYQVIGVVRDAHRSRVIESHHDAMYYLPLDVMPTAGWDADVVIIRADPSRLAAILADVRARIKRIAPSGEPVLKRMTEYLEPDYRPFRLGATLFTAFGVLALIVTIVGIYSTVAYGVEQRAHEFSIRAALGATTRDVVRHIVGQELRVVSIGLVAGVVIVLVGGRFVASLLYGIAPTDVRVMAAVAALLLMVAVAATLRPAWRAGRADPVDALRSE